MNRVVTNLLLLYCLILQTPAGEVAEDDGEHGKSVYVVHNHTGKAMKLAMTADYNPVPCTWNNSFVSFMSILIS